MGKNARPETQGWLLNAPVVAVIYYVSIVCIVLTFHCPPYFVLFAGVRLYLVALSFGAQVEVVASGFAFAEGPQWVNDEEVGLCRYHA